MNTPINREIVERKIKELGVPDIGNASIREIVQLVSSIEAVTGDRYIRMEMGVPGLPPAKVGVEAEIEALRNNVASAYPRIDGIQPLKDETSRFVKLFMNIDVKPEGCVPTVGSMEGSYAAFLVSGSCHKERDTVLFIDPGFPVQKQQLLVMGQKYETFDIFDYRGRNFVQNSILTFQKEISIASSIQIPIILHGSVLVTRNSKLLGILLISMILLSLRILHILEWISARIFPVPEFLLIRRQLHIIPAIMF
jgi:hypothetical protein